MANTSKNAFETLSLEDLHKKRKRISTWRQVALVFAVVMLVALISEIIQEGFSGNVAASAGVVGSSLAYARLNARLKEIDAEIGRREEVVE